MELKVQKRLAGIILKCSPKRVSFDPEQLEEIKGAITKRDIRRLIGDGIITEKQKTGVSRVRARKRLSQKRKGLRKGTGHRKGSANARASKKTTWIQRIRHQRQFLLDLKTRKLITTKTFVLLYNKAKGGFFRSKRHIKIYIDENKLISKKQ
ncbi:MAG: 50S ribosomal protein L19e [Nanoarchaeota archaeon]